VVGAGIIGLATARCLRGTYPDLRITILEKEADVATHQSGRNSGVIHTGVYYRPGSLKARLCVAGAAEMRAFCASHDIPVYVRGKLIVATEAAEFEALSELERRAHANGVHGARILSGAELREHEPHAAGLRALWVPEAAVVDFRAVCLKLAELLRAEGVELRTGVEVRAFARKGTEVVVATSGGEIAAHTLINCAGLHSDRIARLAGHETGLQIIPFRGEYYHLKPERCELVRGLVYPVPDPRFPFLGVHFTRSVDNEVHAGPNAVLALKREGYGWGHASAGDVAEMVVFPGFWRMALRFWRAGAEELYRSLSKAAFTHALQKLVPEVRASDLVPGGSGVRAQAVDRDGRLVDDFHFVCADGMVHVCNVPSPAATASLAIAQVIVETARRAGALPSERGNVTRSAC
jgi:L-2-hydroxyglutarate oxidase LhgO